MNSHDVFARRLLEEEKLISGISKGVYAIGKLNVQNEPDIMREYTENGKRIVFFQ